MLSENKHFNPILILKIAITTTHETAFSYGMQPIKRNVKLL